MKRRVREATRGLAPFETASFDVVIVAFPAADRASFPEIQAELSSLGERLRTQWAGESQCS